MKNKKIAVVVAIQQIVMVRSAAFAATISTLPSTTSLDDVIQDITTWILGLAGAVAVLFLIIGGVQYVISAGNPTSAEKAKKTIIFALIGIVIIAASALLVNVVLDLIGA